jgi:hypothetical protein
MSIPTNMETNEDWKNIKLCIHKSRIWSFRNNVLMKS